MNNYKEIFTIDPGISNGSISRMIGSDIKSWNIDKMKKFENLVIFWDEQVNKCQNPLIIIEKISDYSDDFQNTGRAFRLQKLKSHYIELLSIIKLRGIPYIEVMPKSWQKYLSIYKPGEEYDDRKHRFKAIAERLFSMYKVTLKNCDSLLLLVFTRKKLNYDPLWIQENIKNEKS